MHITSLHEGRETGDRLHDVGHSRVMYFSKTKKRLHALFHQWQIKSSIQGSYWFMVSILVGLSKNSSRLFRSFKRFLNNTGFIFLTLVPFSKLNFISTHCYAKSAYVWEEYRNLITVNSSTFLPKTKEIYLHCLYKPSILCTSIDQSQGSLFCKIKPSTKYIVCVSSKIMMERKILKINSNSSSLHINKRVEISARIPYLFQLTCALFFIARYSSKYRDTKKRLRELGLLDANSTGAIFALDDWEMPREKLILNRKLGEGAFGAVFGGEGLGLMGSNVSVPVAVKTLRVGATIEDKVGFIYRESLWA